MKKPLGLFFIVFALLAVAWTAKVFFYPPLKLQAVQLLPQPKLLEDVELNYDGNRVKLDLLKNRWVLVFFGYSSCPDVCPLELQKLGAMLESFDKDNDKDKPVVVFVSVDPERDKPDVVKEYVRFFNADILGLTATNAELARLARFFGVAYNRTVTIAGKEYLVEAGADMPANAGEHYTVNHSTRIFIVDPDLHYVGSFAPPHDAAILYADMRQLIHP